MLARTRRRHCAHLKFIQEPFQVNFRTFPPGDPEIEALSPAADGLGSCAPPGDADPDELSRFFVIAAAAVGFLLDEKIGQRS